MPILSNNAAHSAPKRRKGLWWMLALGMIIGGGVASFFWLSKNNEKNSNHIARLHISGIIVEDQDLSQRIQDIRNNEKVKAAILVINSPGGTTTGGESLFEDIRNLAQEKPVVAQVNGVGASAAYMIATAADHIVARKSSLVGSIGVLIEYPNFVKALNNLGIKMETIKSSPLKGEPSSFNDTTEEVRKILQDQIIDSYDWFANLVAERRSLKPSEIKTIADGRIYTGRQAIKLKLVDSLGGEPQALIWLFKKGIDKNLNVVDWEPEKGIFFTDFLNMLGLSRLGASLEKFLAHAGVENIFMHGLLSLWKPV